MSKYADQITEIAETVARIDERTEGTNKRLDKMNDSQAKQWNAINKSVADIVRLEERQDNMKDDQSGWNRGLILFSTAIGAIATVLGVKR